MDDGGKSVSNHHHSSVQTYSLKCCLLGDMHRAKCCNRQDFEVHHKAECHYNINTVFNSIMVIFLNKILYTMGKKLSITCSNHMSTWLTCMFRSVCVSRALVASSSNIIAGFLSMVREMATRCFSPPLSFSPRSPTCLRSHAMLSTPKRQASACCDIPLYFWYHCFRESMLLSSHYSTWHGKITLWRW